MKVNNQLKACVLAALCLSLPAALKADDTSTTTANNSSATAKSTAAGDTENINNNTTASATTGSADANSVNTTANGSQKSTAAGDTENTPAMTANQNSSTYNNNGTYNNADNQAGRMNGTMDSNKATYSSSSSFNATSGMATEVMADNKASGIIGMEVRNNSDEKLGRIKDLVLDLQSGRISYAVLDGGSVFKSKLFAVPLSSFTASADNRYLILNADKSKMEAAQGFDKAAWPSVNNPDWGASTFLNDQPVNSNDRDNNRDNNWQQHRMNRNGVDNQNAPSSTPMNQ